MFLSFILRPDFITMSSSKNCFTIVAGLLAFLLISSSNAAWPPAEWRSDPTLSQFYRLLWGNTVVQGEASPADLTAQPQELFTIPAHLLPPTSPTKPNPLFLAVRSVTDQPSNQPLTDVCQFVICPKGSYCENFKSQCSNPPCPNYAECKVNNPAIIDPCSLPEDGGNCSDRYQQWYWNDQQKACTMFTYSGCGGNANRFPTLISCQDQCDRREKICRLFAETGTCRAAFWHWYYDVISGVCKQFVFGGCGGNGNNFLDFNDCTSTCQGIQ